jgi:hypothetical protein
MYESAKDEANMFKVQSSIFFTNIELLKYGNGTSF